MKTRNNSILKRHFIGETKNIISETLNFDNTDLADIDPQVFDDNYDNKLVY